VIEIAAEGSLEDRVSRTKEAMVAGADLKGLAPQRRRREFGHLPQSPTSNSNRLTEYIGVRFRTINNTWHREEPIYDTSLASVSGRRRLGDAHALAPLTWTEQMPAISRIMTGNQLLDTLPDDAFSRVSPHLERIPLPVHFSLYKPGDAVIDVYFVTEGMVSIVATMGDGALVEVGIIGREGFAGLPALLSGNTGPHEVYMQIAGAGLRMKASAMLAEIERSVAFKGTLSRYAQFFLTQVSQTAACNARHPLELRLARWLLMARDRVDTDVVPLTHEFLSIMLGVQRPGVSIAASALRKAGLIEYSHGRITVVDRRGLEGASCECYRVVSDEFSRSFTQ
jgi:CRP-like cAMP-binding protein